MKEEFFKAESKVERLANMIELHKNPQSKELRELLKIGDDVLGAPVRQQELRNWV